MKMICKTKIRFVVFLALIFFTVRASAAERSYYQLKIYHLKTETQQRRVEQYLQNAYLPAMHKMGIKQVGVFIPVELDTADRKVYVFTPFKSLEEMENADQKLMNDPQYMANAKEYINAAYNNLPYLRYETIVLKAFPDMPVPAKPLLSSNKTDRVYELRSYESPTEKYNVNKVKMFNAGGEIPLFKRLNFNAIFYAGVIAGSHMPNLMYMTSFNNKKDRDEHWNIFSADAEWKELSAKPEYQHSVSKNETVFLRPADYSDF